MVTAIDMEDNASDGKMTNEQRQLFFQYLPLVGYAVKRVVGYGTPPEPLEYSDLVQLGMIGLMDAVKRYDPTRGVQFQTYALNRIRGTIQDELRKLDWVPRSIRREERQNEEKLKYLEQVGYFGSTEEMATRLSMTTEEYRQLLTQATTLSKETKLRIDDDEKGVEIAEEDEDKNPFRKIQKKELRDAVYNAIEQLDQRDRLVLILYYYEELTFKEIARILKLTESRVSQIHEEIMKQLREQLKGHTL